MNWWRASANAIIAANCLYAHKKFWRGANNMKSVQKNKLLSYISQNKTTRFGKNHHFDKIKNYQDYCHHVPLTAYSDYQPYVDHLMAGKQSQLTNQVTTLLEPTSGTTSTNKLIPYNKLLQQEFMAGIKPWLADLYQHDPALKQGVSYWSVSPIESDSQYGHSKIKIGFEDDDQYFGWLSLWLGATHAVPKQVRQIKHIDNFRYITGLMLLAAGDLSLISVWHPSFLTIILDYCNNHLDLLLKSLGTGRLEWPVPEEHLPIIKLKRNKARAAYIGSFLREGPQWPAIWPKLKLISCWADGASAPYLPKLQSYFPNVMIQGKGLLATEGLISFPVVAVGGSVLAYQSHFYEFLAEKNNKIVLADELEIGQRYSVIITTGGGLYRYQLNDLIEVTGVYHELPSLKFIGRKMTSDYVGEKLSEAFVLQVIQQLCPNNQQAFAMLAPLKQNNEFGYCLYLQSHNNRLAVKALEKQLEQLLSQNYHYRYARELGQLNRSKVQIIKSDGAKQFQAFQLAKGKKLGDIKAVALYTELDSDQCFPEGVIHAPNPN